MNTEYIVAKSRNNGKQCFCLFGVSNKHFGIYEMTDSLEELLILIDLKGYNKDEIEFSDELKDYEYKEN